MQKFNGFEWQPPQVVTLVPDIGTINYQLGREINTGLRRSLKQDEGRLLWLTDETPVEGSDSLDTVVFDVEPRWASGRKDSVQGVFFGRLALSDVIETPVAVKPFLTAFNAGAHEAAMLLSLEARGLRAYRLLGMGWTPEQGFVNVTAFEEESRSLDNVDWKKGLSHPLGKHLTNLEAIEQMGQSLGLMHGNGIIHNDAQVKNFAVNGPEVVLIDLVQARSMVKEDGYVDEVTLQEGMYKDLRSVLQSLRKRGFLRDAGASEWGSFFSNVVAPAYRSGLFLAEGVIKDKGVPLEDIVAQTVRDVHSVFESE